MSNLSLHFSMDLNYHFSFSFLIFEVSIKTVHFHFFKSLIRIFRVILTSQSYPGTPIYPISRPYYWGGNQIRKKMLGLVYIYITQKLYHLIYIICKYIGLDITPFRQIKNQTSLIWDQEPKSASDAKSGHKSGHRSCYNLGKSILLLSMEFL